MVGPSAKSLAPKVANFFILLVIAMDIYALVYLFPDFTVFAVINIILGIITLILMWTVQCSDPGIQSRIMPEAINENNGGAFNFNDSIMSLNQYEKDIFNPEDYNQPAAYIYEETRFYFHRYCQTCKI